MKARAALRAATAEEHDRVDRLFSRLDLRRTEDYRLFLLGQASAHLPVETALDEAGADALLADWPLRRRAEFLRADLKAMDEAPPPPVKAPPLPDAAATLGAIYVLEGSRLGGALLKRGLPPHAPKQFLDAPQPPGSWRKLLETLDEFLYEPASLDSAAGAAKQVFSCFEAGGLRLLESRVE